MMLYDGTVETGESGSQTAFFPPPETDPFVTVTISQFTLSLENKASVPL